MDISKTKKKKRKDFNLRMCSFDESDASRRTKVTVQVLELLIHSSYLSCWFG